MLPHLLWLETTNHCNSHCYICQIWKNHEPEPPLRVAKTLQSPLFRKINYILNSGGEPTLLGIKGLFELLSFEHQILPRATLQLSTNGILIETIYNVIRSKLPTSNVKIDVGLSLDGIGAAHDIFRGVSGNYQRIVCLIGMLKAMQKEYPGRLRLMLGSTLTEYTVKQTDELLAFSKRMGIPFMWHWFNRASFYNNEALDEEDTWNFEKAILKVMPKPSLYRDMWIASLHNAVPKFKCYALQNFCVLKRNGDIVPCLSMWNESIGNVFGEEPLKIWHSQRAKDVRSKIVDCAGCLNNWGVNFSLQANYFPLLKYAINQRLSNWKRKN